MICPICEKRGCAVCGYTGRRLYHSYKESNERYTPRLMIELVREVIGHIDCDPASSTIANQVVGADIYYTREENGLEQNWYGGVFCNPPFGRLPNINGGYQKLFIDKGIREYRIGHAREIVFLLLGNILFTGVGRDLWEWPMCLWEDTVLFRNEKGETCSYGFGILFMYLGHDRCRFRKVFEPYGYIHFPDCNE